MTRRLVPLLLMVAGVGFARAQSVTYSTPDTAYMHHVEAAFVHLQRNECRPCLDAYEKAFRIAQRSCLSLLRAATCAYSCREKKRAAQYLDKALDLEWDGPHRVFTTYPEFKPYRHTPFEKDLLTHQARKIKQLGLDERPARNGEILPPVAGRRCAGRTGPCLLRYVYRPYPHVPGRKTGLRHATLHEARV